MPGAIDGKSSGDNLLVRHIFCLECANSLGLSLPTAGGRRCPACQTLLSNPDDTVSTNLNPTDDYKTSVLSGLDPNTIMECTGRALGFWTYQSTQEIFYQDFLGKSLTEKYSNLNTQMDKVIHNANSEITLWTSRLRVLADIWRQTYKLRKNNSRKKNQELADLNREKSKKLSQMTNLYNLLKARAMRTEMQTAASDTVSQTLNNLSSRNSTMLPPIKTHVRPPPITTKARSRQGHTPKTRSYHLSPEGVERLHRYQRSGTGNSRRAGEQDSSIPMAPLGRLVWNTKSRK
ncbi:cyclin [Penicillium atrosanguineum]|nr:cyclin [Penicillium atrosanguineum]